jgi:molecular chaperone DnaK
MADQDRREQRTAVGLLVRLSYGSVDEFVEKFATNISRGGVFIRTRDPKPVGTVLNLELRLAGGEAVIRASGVVRWIAAQDPSAHPPTAPGMGVQFLSLDDQSRQIVERMVTLREQRGLAPGLTRPAPTAERPARTPEATRAPVPAMPVPPAAPPATTPAPIAPGPPAATAAPKPPGTPAQADLSARHRLEQVAAGPARIETGLPDRPVPISNPSRLVIGIDLGTSNSCAAIVKGGRPYVIPSREGYNIVPSIVALNARHKLVVGHGAKAQLLTNPKNTVWGAKRLVGRAFDSPIVQEIKSKFAYEIVAGDDGLSAVRLGHDILSLEQISALVLREVRDIAQSHVGEEVNRAVITVPAYYNERQRAAVRNAGALAGLQVERILNEPTAAALAYAFGRKVKERVLVYDLGGGTFDASVLELEDNVYEVISTGGDTFLGGVDFDNRIVEKLLGSYEEKVGRPFDGDRVALSRLVDAAERAKCSLSELQEFDIQLPYLAMVDSKPVAFEDRLTREEIVRLVEPLVDRTIQVCAEVLEAKGLTPKDIDEVLLVGGQSRMPLVHDKVKAFFGKPASKAVHPDEAVAIGAALLAHSLGSVEGVVLIDVLPMSIGVGLPGDRVKTIIERNTPLPTRKQYGLATTRDGQTEFELMVFQGDSPQASACEYLGTLKLTGLPPGPRGMVKIAVGFELGAECLLTVTARDLHSNRLVKAVMHAGDGAEAAKKKLATAGGNGKAATAAQAEPAVPPGPARRPGLGGFLRRLFGRGETSG